MDDQVLFSCKNICKNFSSTRALVDVDFEIRRGQVCGLIGENGSGKSTLTSIIAGVQPQTSGEMFRAGEPYSPTSMVDAQKHGVAMVVQEASTLPTVNVMSNVFVGNLERFFKKGVLNLKDMEKEATRILEEIGTPEIKANMPLGVLNFEDRKLVEIARAVYLNPEILIIDETTTALAQKGRQLLYRIIEKMKQENKAVIFISHDLEELVQVCNTITVLRDGKVVGHLEGDQITTQNMRPMMVGREMSENYYRADWDGTSGEEVVLDVKHITSEDGYIENLDIQLHKGEILGFGGLANSGMHEVGRMIFGINRYVTGSVVHVPSGKEIRNSFDSIKNSIGYVSKDRDTESIVLTASIKDNTIMASLKKLANGIHISPKKEKELAQGQIDQLSIKCVSGKQLVNQLSGGNKQKVAFGKWLAVGSEIYIMDCPTRGIDIGVKKAMYDLIYKFKQEGKSIIMISEELPELIGMSDRMLIFKDGKVSAEIMRSKDVTDTMLIEHMV